MHCLNFIITLNGTRLGAMLSEFCGNGLVKQMLEENIDALRLESESEESDQEESEENIIEHGS